jgi:hypothetical protein
MTSRQENPRTDGTSSDNTPCTISAEVAVVVGISADAGIHHNYGADFGHSTQDPGYTKQIKLCDPLLQSAFTRHQVFVSTVDAIGLE